MARRTFLAQLAGLPFFLRTAKADQAKECVGRRRSDHSRISFLARTGPFGIWTRGPDIPVGRSDPADAKGYGSVKRWKNWSPDMFRFLLEGACSRARGVSETNLARCGAKFANRAVFVSLVECADRIIVE
jgi:hypothetical protein